MQARSGGSGPSTARGVVAHVVFAHVALALSRAWYLAGCRVIARLGLELAAVDSVATIVDHADRRVARYGIARANAIGAAGIRAGADVLVGAAGTRGDNLYTNGV